MSNRLEGNTHVAGTLTASAMTLPPNSVTDPKIAAGSNIDPLKLQHQHRQTYAQESATAAAAESRVLHAVRGATGSAVHFEAGCVVACLGDSTITVDLLKNGVSILTAVITIDSGDSAYAVVEGTIATPALVDGDVLELAIVATVGTGTLGTGLFASLTVHELPQ